MHTEDHEDALWAVILADAPDQEAAVRELLGTCDGCAAFAAELVATLPAVLEAAGGSAQDIGAANAQLDRLLAVAPSSATGDAGVAPSHLSLMPAVANDDVQAPSAPAPRRAWWAGLGTVAAAAAGLLVWANAAPDPTPTSPRHKGAPAQIQLVVKDSDLPQADVESGLQVVTPALRACFDRPAGTVSLQLTINRQGRVDTAVHTRGPELVAACLAPIIRRATMTPPDAPATATVQFSWKAP